MRKSMKKMVAIVSALTVMASGINFSATEAASEKVQWFARDYNLPDTSKGKDIIGYATMHASSETYTGLITYMTDLANRKLTLNCTTHKMSTGPLVYNNVGSMSWTISGAISNVTYRMDAYTSMTANLKVYGIIER